MLFINKVINKLVSKNPKTFRSITFKCIYILNFILYFLLICANILYTLIFKYKISYSRKIRKVIIRNDQIGDCILTLPFILGTINNEKYYYISPLIEKIITRINIKNNWYPVSNLDNKSNLFIANLSTSDYKTFKNRLPKAKSKMIFTQFSYNFYSQNGFPLLFSPNYNSNKSQTKFVKNCFKRLEIKTDPILGIKSLNNHFEYKDQSNSKDSILLVLGLGIDKGRQLNQNLIKKII